MIVNIDLLRFQKRSNKITSKKVNNNEIRNYMIESKHRL